MIHFDKSQFLETILNTTDKQELSHIKIDYCVKPRHSVGTCHDLEEIIYHELNDDEREKVLGHIHKISTTDKNHEIHIITDIDDTVFSSKLGGFDVKFNDHTVYPGVNSMYHQILCLPFLTALSARPEGMEQLSREHIQTLLKLDVNMLSGHVYDLCDTDIINDVLSRVTIGLTGYGNQYPTEIGHISGEKNTEWYDAYHKMGNTKFQSIMRFVKLFPEYKFIFIGDSGQGDLICAYLIQQERLKNPQFPVMCSLIHNILKIKDLEILNKHRYKLPNINNHLMISRPLTKQLEQMCIYMFNNYIDVARILKKYHVITNEIFDKFAHDTINEFDKCQVYDNMCILRDCLKNDLVTSMGEP